MKNYEYLIPDNPVPADVFRFGVVTSTGPIRVQLDGDTAPVAVTPITTCLVGAGDRVLVLIHNRQLLIVGRVTPDGMSAQRIHLTATDDASETSTDNPLQIGPNGGYRVIMDTNEFMALDGSNYANFFIHANMLGLVGSPAGTSFGPYLEDRTGPSGAQRAGLKNSGGDTYFQVEGMWTTTNAANCYVNTSGTLYRSTSVRAAKLAIEDITDAQLDALQNVRMRTWFDKRDAEQLADDLTNGTNTRTESGPLKRQAGVVAEEIEELGLEAFLTRGADGQLEGVAYDRLGVAALPLIRRQAARIDALEARLAKLEALLGKDD